MAGIALDEVRARTRALLGLAADGDVSWVTEAWLAAEADAAPAVPEDFPRRLWGICVAWGHRPGVGPTFEFAAGAGNGRYPDSPERAIGGLRWWAPQSGWRYRPERAPDDAPPFRRIGRFEWWG